MENDDPLLRLEAAAHHVLGPGCGIDGRSLYRAYRTEQLTCYMLRRKLFTRPSHVKAWAEGGRAQPPISNVAPPSAADADEASARCEAAIASLRGARHV